jgi:iron complex outermembrane receptor protein
VPSTFPGGDTLSPLTPRAADWTHGWPRRDDGFIEASIRADYDISKAIRLTSISSYQHLDEDKQSDIDANFLEATNYRQFGKIDAFTQELRLSGESGRLNWLAGVNYAHADIPDALIGEIRDLSLTKPIPSLSAFPEVATRTRTRINSYAGFANLEYGVTDHLTLIGGLRYTQTNRRFAGCTYASTQQFADLFNAIQAMLVQAGAKTTPIIPIGTGDCSNLDANFDPVLNRNSLNEHNLSFRAGANYKSGGGVLLYASVSRGYKSGGSPVIPSSVSAQLDPVTQERLLAYEAGFKAPLIDGRVQLNAAAFYYDYKDKQLRGRVLDPIFFVLERLVNIPKSRVLGGEVGLQARPIEGLDIGLSGTYSDTKVLRYRDFNDDGVPLDYRGSPFPYTPKIQFVADAQYAFGLGGNRKFFLGAGARHNSGSRTIFVSPASPQPSDSIYRIKGYTLADIRAGFQDADGDWRVSIWGRNITNQYYWTNVFNANDVKFRLPGRPAEYGISFSVRVGQKLRL